MFDRLKQAKDNKTEGLGLIDVYYWPTPNGYKITIMLEECGLPYNIIPVNISKGDQFKPDFLKISPNNRMPAIVDPDGPNSEPIAIFESGAILIYLAEKTGKFMPAAPRGRYEVLQWLMLQMGGGGPMLGQAHHFRNYAPEKIEYAINRYTNESGRLYNVIDKRLEDREYLAGDYSIADMATMPWILGKRQGHSFDDFPNLKEWRERLKARPALQKGWSVMRDEVRSVADQTKDKERWEVLFGSKQFQRR